VAAAAGGTAVKPASAGIAVSTVDYLVALADALDAGLVGHKFARQAELHRNGFPVPEFFCVPGSTFDTVVAGPVSAGSAPGTDASPAEVAAWAERLHARARQVPVPPALAARLLASFDVLVGTGGLVAVRGCAVARADGGGEDSVGDPFAGLSDSYLYVGRQDLVRRVVDCWASAYNPRAVQYRLLRGLDPLAASIAVGVQRMVPAARSFVAFSRDPLDGARRCVIAAAYGLGEGVVQERADLDHFSVDRATGAVVARLAHKARMMGPDPADPGRGPVPLPVPAAAADTAVLTDEEARRIAALAVQVEEHFGTAQDIEGAVTGNGQILLVQARPAVLATPAAVVTYTNSNATESYPGVSSVLTYSVAVDLTEAAFHDFYRRMGVPMEVLRRNRYELRRLAVHLKGRVYYRLDTWYRLHSQLPSFDLLRGTWEQALGIRRAAQPDPATGTRRFRRLRTAWWAATLPVRMVRTRRAVRGALRWWDGYFAAEMDRPARTPAEIVEEHQRLWGDLGERWGPPSVNNFHGLVTVRLTTLLLKRWAGGVAPSVVNGMLCGGAESRSAAALRSTVELAEQVRCRPALRVALAGGDAHAVWRRVVGGEFGADFATAVHRYVRRYGDRGPQDLKLETDTIRTAPWSLLPILHGYADQNLTVAGNRRQEQEVRAEAERELRTHCRNPLQRAVLKLLYASMRECTRMREDTRFCRSQIVGVTRDRFLALGANLARSGALERPRDVLDLTVQEVLGVYQGTVAAADLRGLVAWRRAQRESWQREPDLPARFTVAASGPLAHALPVDRSTAPHLAASRHLTGIGSSPGRVRGRARVVRDPRTDGQACRDRVLVARETDPGWLFLMMGARGMVVECGSPLSHTAITGRVLAIPTVVAVTGATSLIKDGAWVELDGAAGTVTVLDGPPPEGDGP
jgi:pyruvate,water dikinase